MKAVLSNKTTHVITDIIEDVNLIYIEGNIMTIDTDDGFSEVDLDDTNVSIEK